MCSECNDKKLSFSDYRNQKFEFEQKGVKYNRVYLCSECKKKYYIEDTKFSKLIITVYKMFLGGCVLFMSFFANFLIKPMVQNSSMCIKIISLLILEVVILLIIAVLDFIIRDKVEIWAWRWTKGCQGDGSSDATHS